MVSIRPILLLRRLSILHSRKYWNLLHISCLKMLNVMWMIIVLFFANLEQVVKDL